MVQHWCNITGHFIAENSLNCARFFTATMAKKNPVAIETTGFFCGTPERISPLGDKPRIRGAQQKNLPHGRFFRGTPERISPFGDKPRIRGAQQKNLPHGRFFRVITQHYRFLEIAFRKSVYDSKKNLMRRDHLSFDSSVVSETAPSSRSVTT